MNNNDNNNSNDVGGFSPEPPVTMFTEMKPGTLVQLKQSVTLYEHPKDHFVDAGPRYFFNGGKILMYLGEEIGRVVPGYRFPPGNKSPEPANEYAYIMWFLVGEKKLCLCLDMMLGYSDVNFNKDIAGPAATAKRFFEIARKP